MLTNKDFDYIFWVQGRNAGKINEIPHYENYIHLRCESRQAYADGYEKGQQMYRRNILEGIVLGDKHDQN